MQVKVRWKNVAQSTTLVLCCGMGFSPLTARAAAANMPADTFDLRVAAELEQRALTAKPGEQAFLLADLADRMTALAGRQIADGEIEKAEATLERIEDCTSKMESNFQQSRSLKKTELLLHMTNRRLQDLLRVSSFDLKPHVQQTLKRLNMAQTSLLAVLFAK